MRRLLANWPRLVFLYLPLLIIAIDGAILVYEEQQPDSVKAIRLVRESMSRKSGFTVQQFLYATVYHRRKIGEPINIEGWNVERRTEAESRFVVQFSFEDSVGRHVAVWTVETARSSVVPQNEMATDLCWR